MDRQTHAHACTHTHLCWVRPPFLATSEHFSYKFNYHAFSVILTDFEAGSYESFHFILNSYQGQRASEGYKTEEQAST